MAEKSDEEIIKEESGLEPKMSEEEMLAHLSLNNEGEDKKEEENTKPPLENDLDTSSEETTIKNEDNDDQIDQNNYNADKKEEFEEFDVQKKQPKIFRLLIAIASTLFLVLIIGIVLFFFGFFDSEEQKPQNIVKVEQNKTVPEIVFDEKKINKDELNKKLTLLTKKEIMDKDELEEQERKIAEEKRLKEEKQKEEEAKRKAIEDKKKELENKLEEQLSKIEKEKLELQKQQEIIKKQQEAFLQLQEEAKKKLENKIEKIDKISVQPTPLMEDTQDGEQIPNEPEEKTISSEEIDQMIQEIDTKHMADNSFLSFINVATIKGVLYKSFLDDIQKYDKNISLCRDSKNRIEIYVGPYGSIKEREQTYNLLLENGFKEAYLVDLTKEEYQKRCKY